MHEADFNPHTAGKAERRINDAKMPQDGYAAQATEKRSKTTKVMRLKWWEGSSTVACTEAGSPQSHANRIQLTRQHSLIHPRTGIKCIHPPTSNLPDESETFNIHVFFHGGETAKREKYKIRGNRVRDP
jgi:hypothetical protein